MAAFDKVKYQTAFGLGAVPYLSVKFGTGENLSYGAVSVAADFGGGALWAPGDRPVTAVLFSALQASLDTIRDTAQFTATQTFVDVPLFVSGNTAGDNGSNATIVQVLAADPDRTLIELENNGDNDVELWYGARPSDATVGAMPPKGQRFRADTSRIRDTRVARVALYATCFSGSTRISVVTGAA